jgi:hypothetical protein
MSNYIRNSCHGLVAINSSIFDCEIVNPTILSVCIRHGNPLKSAQEASQISASLGRNPISVAKGGVVITDGETGTGGGSILSSLGSWGRKLLPKVAPQLIHWACDKAKAYGEPEAAQGGGPSWDTSEQRRGFSDSGAGASGEPLHNFLKRVR